RGLEQIASGLRQQRFVRGDHVRAVAQRAPNVGASGVHSADQFDDEVGSVDRFDRVRRQQAPVDARPLFLRVADQNAPNAKIDTGASANPVALAADQLHESPSHCSAAEKADAYLAHATLRAKRAWSRSSIRSRTSSNPTESRIRPSLIPTL